jgi:monoamine oxidase
MDNSEILIIGAGAAGLMAAYTLTSAGKKVTILEARNRCGGRIHTLRHESFFKEAELGPEFVHGDLPVTLGLLKEAGIELLPSGGEMWQYKDGKIVEEGLFDENWDILEEKLRGITKDVSINDFLAEVFPGADYDELKFAVRRFAAGYDTADPDFASAFALRDEWLGEEEGHQHRIKGGYGELISFLEKKVKKSGGEIILNSVAKQIHWEQGEVSVATADGYSYKAGKLLVALPLGVLKAPNDAVAAVSFSPPIEEQLEAVNKFGYGEIIKILLEFNTVFWEDKKTQTLFEKDFKRMGFLLSDEVIPTWWTQVPQHIPILTGWLGGPPAAAMKDTTDDELFALALQSISNIFKRPVDELKEQLIAYHILNWTNDPFTLGSYAYDMVGTSEARKLMSQPVADTLFFAGEYTYGGTVMGTVEAALTSGRDAARLMMNE